MDAHLAALPSPIRGCPPLLRRGDGLRGVIPWGKAQTEWGWGAGGGWEAACPQPRPAALTIQCSETWAGRQTARPSHTQLSFSSPASASPTSGGQTQRGCVCSSSARSAPMGTPHPVPSQQRSEGERWGLHFCWGFFKGKPHPLHQSRVSSQECEE